MSEISDKWLAGFFDGEGSISLKIQPGASKIGYSPIFRWQICQSISEETDICEEIKEYLHKTGLESARIETFEPENSTYPIKTIVITKSNEVKEILERLRPFLKVKEKEACIMLDEIYPLYENQAHWNKQGFLKIIDKKEKLDKPKTTGNKSKYTVEYFENEWDISYQPDKQVVFGYDH